MSVDGAQRPEFGFPLSWCFTEGSGRVFSTTLGHFPHACESVDYLRHVGGGLSWLMGEGG
jgi:type 1 glutamine amidotransferase